MGTPPDTDDAAASRIAELTAELAAANRELEALAAAVSHDLRAPLRAMDAFARALEEDHADRLPEDGRLYLARIRANAERMQAQITDLLRLARLVRGELRRQPIDLSAAAAAVVDGLRQRDAGRRVAVRIAPGLTAVADPALVDVLLEALLDNAWKFTRDRADAEIGFAAGGGDGAAAFVVSDNGAGFDPGGAERLFRPFHRLHHRDEFDGNGIGLALAYKVVSRHGGRIWFDAAPERGARFWFTLAPA